MITKYKAAVSYLKNNDYTFEEILSVVDVDIHDFLI